MGFGAVGAWANIVLIQNIVLVQNIVLIQNIGAVGAWAGRSAHVKPNRKKAEP